MQIRTENREKKSDKNIELINAHIHNNLKFDYILKTHFNFLKILADVYSILIFLQPTMIWFFNLLKGAVKAFEANYIILWSKIERWHTYAYMHLNDKFKVNYWCICIIMLLYFNLTKNTNRPLELILLIDALIIISN